ncbi:anti-sigma factor domain-containing protein [Deinococcus sp. YIM 77859]|uniref:anti-sigma factor n=1 Tax=Deinococcus sp. YIM 77859 TaxID=1540221 RepID=UPI00054D718B|nr:anti-sigma factor [Deinococcus sp. YIM 77859]
MKPDRDDLLAYALGTLPPAEAARVEAALAADPALRAELRADLDALSHLLDDLDPGAVTVPADAGERLLARVRAEGRLAPPLRETPRARPAPRRPSWRFSAGLALAAALALAIFLLSQVDEDAARRYARLPGAVVHPIEVNGTPLGTAVRLPDGRVYVGLTRPLEQDRTYQLWQIENGSPVSRGVFQEGLLLRLPPEATIAVSVEPRGGSPQPTTQPLFIQKL